MGPLCNLDLRKRLLLLPGVCSHGVRPCALCSSPLALCRAKAWTPRQWIAFLADRAVLEYCRAEKMKALHALNAGRTVVARNEIAQRRPCQLLLASCKQAMAMWPLAIYSGRSAPAAIQPLCVEPRARGRLHWHRGPATIYSCGHCGWVAADTWADSEGVLAAVANASNPPTPRAKRCPAGYCHCFYHWA